MSYLHRPDERGSRLTIKHLMIEGFVQDILSCQHPNPKLVTGKGFAKGEKWVREDGKTEVMEPSPTRELLVCLDCGMLLIRWQKELGEEPEEWIVHPTLLEMMQDRLKAKNLERLGQEHG